MKELRSSPPQYNISNKKMSVGSMIGLLDIGVWLVSFASWISFSTWERVSYSEREKYTSVQNRMKNQRRIHLSLMYEGALWMEPLSPCASEVRPAILLYLCHINIHTLHLFVQLWSIDEHDILTPASYLSMVFIANGMTSIHLLTFSQ